MISEILKAIQMCCENIKKNKIKYLSYLLYAFLIGFLVYYILIGSKVLFNSDSAFVNNLSEEIIKYKTFFTTSWNHSNDFWFYSLIPLMVPLMKIGIKVFTSRQIAALVQTIFMFYLLYKIFYDKKNKSIFKIISLLVLSGISAQMYFELFGDATYGSIVVYMLLSVYLFIKYCEKSKNINCIFLGILLTFLTACSLRFPIFIAAPLIVVLGIFIYKDGFKKKYIYLLIAIILSTLLGYVFNNILKNNLNLISILNDDLVNTSYKFVTSVISTCYNYLTAIGATGTNIITLTVNYNKNISTSSPLIVLVFIKYVCAFITILIPFLLLKYYKKFNMREKIIYIYTVAVTFIIIFFSVICNLLWYRYFIPITFFLVLLYAMFYKYFMSNNKKNKIIFWISLVIVIFTNVIFNFMSIYSFEKKAFISNYYQDITDILVKEDLSYGYTYTSEEHNLYNLLSDGKIRIIRFRDDSYKISKWLISNDWIESNYHNGKVFFLRRKDSNSFKYEKKAKKTIECGEFLIFVYESNNQFLKFLVK